MKKLIYVITIGLVVCSCGGSGGDEPKTSTPPVENNAPSVPSLVAPVNNALCIDNEVEFKWNAATDADSDAISYEIQIANDTQFSQIAHTFKGETINKTVSLEKGVAYYWRVKAIDSKNASSSYSSVYNLYTEGEGDSNHLPFSPTLISPALNTVILESTATLEWSASDVDGNDILSFDVYFGTSNPPTQKQVENQTSNTLSVSLEPSINYYWKVVVKDGSGGETIGQIWNFTTD